MLLCSCVLVACSGPCPAPTPGQVVITVGNEMHDGGAVMEPVDAGSDATSCTILDASLAMPCLDPTPLGVCLITSPAGSVQLTPYCYPFGAVGAHPIGVACSPALGGFACETGAEVWCCDPVIVSP